MFSAEAVKKCRQNSTEEGARRLESALGAWRKAHAELSALVDVASVQQLPRLPSGLATAERWPPPCPGRRAGARFVERHFPGARRCPTPFPAGTLFITGASRGIGLAIELRAARDGANVAMATKSASSIETSRHDLFGGGSDRTSRRQGAAARRRRARRDPGARGAGEDRRNLREARHRGQQREPDLADHLPSDRDEALDLMHQVNARGPSGVEYAVAYLEKSDNAHILMLSPPLDLEENGSLRTPPMRWRNMA